MYCFKCGADVGEGAGFCPKCGANLMPGASAVKVSGDGSKTALIVIGIAFAVMVCIAFVGILAAIAVPNFLKYQAKAKQAEAKTNLKGIFVSQISYYGKHGQYAKTFDELDFELAGGRSLVYCFYLGPDEVIPAGCSNAGTVDIDAWAGEDGFKAVAVGNIDSDPTLDVWAIDNDYKLVNVVNDVRD